MIEGPVRIGLALGEVALRSRLVSGRPGARGAYPVAGGRLLLRARLRRSCETPGPPPLSGPEPLLLEPGPPSARVTLVRRTLAPPPLIRGWERALVGPLSSVMLAASLISLSTLAPRARPAPAEGVFPQAGEASRAEVRAGSLAEGAAWERELLLADIQIPQPHVFKRVVISGSGGGGGGGGGVSDVFLPNIVTTHSNTPMMPHSNVDFVAHTNTAAAGYPPAP